MALHAREESFGRVVAERGGGGSEARREDRRDRSRDGALLDDETVVELGAVTKVDDPRDTGPDGVHRFGFAVAEADPVDIRLAVVAEGEHVAVAAETLPTRSDNESPFALERRRISVEPSVPADRMTMSAVTKAVGASNFSRPSPSAW